MKHEHSQSNKPEQSSADVPQNETESNQPQRPAETGGPKGLEPTRYGDWERKGRCIDF